MDARIGDQTGRVYVDYRGVTTTLHFQEILPSRLVTHLETKLASATPPPWLTLPEAWQDDFETPDEYIRAFQDTAANWGFSQGQSKLGVDRTADTVPTPVRDLITAYTADDIDIPPLLPDSMQHSFADDVPIGPPEFFLGFWITADGDATNIQFLVQHSHHGLAID